MKNSQVVLFDGVRIGCSAMRGAADWVVMAMVGLSPKPVRVPAKKLRVAAEVEVSRLAGRVMVAVRVTSGRSPFISRAPGMAMVEVEGSLSWS